MLGWIYKLIFDLTDSKNYSLLYRYFTITGVFRIDFTDLQ